MSNGDCTSGTVLANGLEQVRVLALAEPRVCMWSGNIADPLLEIGF